MNLFIPITKVDETRREVWGVAAEEAPDKSGEIMDYVLSKPRFAAWSKSISDATGGKSLGNVRAMHQSIAAGKVIDMRFDDESKRVYIGARIVDDNEWRKVTEGVYTGFSVGGRYGSQKYEGGLMRYEAIPAEVSIVDNPCMQGATFSMVKANGMTEQVPFAAASPELAKAAQALGALAKAGARHSSSDMQMIQTMHDNACTLGAVCAAPEKSDAMKSAGSLMRKGDSEPERIAWAAGSAVSDIASALAFVSQLAARLVSDDAAVAAKLGDAVSMIQSALADKADEQVVAARAAAVDEANDEAMEAQIKAQVAANAAGQQAASEEFGPVSPVEQTAPAAEMPAPLAAEAPAAPAPAPAATAAMEPEQENAINKADMAEFRGALLADVKAAVKDIVNAGAAAPLHKIESANAELTKRFDEVATRLGALEGRLVKVESAPVGTGPVLREVGIGSGSDDGAFIASLDQLIKDESDPTVRQALMAKRAAAALKNTYRSGGVRIG